MSTTVSSATIGVVSTGLSPSDWKDVSNLLGTNNESDNLYAFYEFDGTPDAGQEYDEALYLRDWGFSLPEFSVVENIQLDLERKATGTGTVTDEDIRLYFPTAPAPAYDSANLTINQASGAAWPSTDGFAIYSGTWNKSWTEEEINNAMFGVFIRATESVTTNNTALIDYVKLTISYHQEILVDGTGGSTCGGSATVEFIDSIEGSGGVSTGGIGLAPYTFEETASGGILAEGTATLAEEVSASGGVVAGGQSPVVFEEIGSGGIVAGGTSPINFIDYIDGTGGIVANGEAQVEAGIFGSSGVEIGGNAIDTKIVGSITSEGGVETGGLAEVSPIIAEGGSNVGGSAIVTTNFADPSESGGTEIGGQFLVIESEPTSGGVVSGDPYYLLPIYVSHTIPDWEFPLEGSQVVPTPNLDTTATAYAQFWYDPIDRNLSWKITYSGFDGPIEVARIREGDPGETGPLLIDLFTDPNSEIATVSSEFAGMVKGVSSALHDQLTTAGGKSAFYIMFGSTTDKIRSNFWHYGVSASAIEAPVEPYFEIVSGGAETGGDAFIDPVLAEGGIVTGESAEITVIDYIDGTGGVVAGGVSGIATDYIVGSGGVVINSGAADDIVDEVIATSGAIANGSAIVAVSQLISGGAICGGSAEVQFVFNKEGSGGVITNGESIPTLAYLVISEGGAIANGNSPAGITIPVGGGIVVGGEIGFAYISNPVITGGVVTGGQHLQTFIDYYIATGGVRISGKGNGNKIKFFQKFKTGVCRALASDNICKDDPFQQELLPPPGTDVGELDPNRFRIEYLPTWCEVEKVDKLQPYNKVRQNCDAAVPEVVNTRQKGVLPPKTGRAQIRDRGIATLDAL